MNRFALPTAVYLLFFKDGKILLQKRANTGYKDGEFGVPSGHKEANETLTAAALREAKEEVGVTLNACDISLTHVSHRNSGDREYLDFYFIVRNWEGEICNCEPDKCDEICWFPKDKLPDNAIDYVVDVLGRIENNLHFSELGWGNEYC